MLTFTFLTALLAIHTTQGSWIATTQPPTPTTTVGLTFGLTLANVERLDDHLQSVSDPASPNYGHYATTDELNLLYPTAHPQAPQHIQEWLQASSPTAVVDTSVHGFVMASVPIMDLPLLFPNITLLSYEESPPHQKRQRPSVVRATKPVTVPPRIASLIDFMSGLEYLPTHTPSSKLRVDPVSSPSSFGVDPPSLRTQYKIGTTVCTHANTTQATANFLGEGYTEADLAFFFEVFYPSSDGQKVSKVVGPNNAPSLEASLDIQYISSIGFGATTWWISDDDTHNQQEPFLAYMILLSNTTDTPWVHSISYADLEWSQDTAYTQRVDTEMAKAGLRGITLLVASGDDGAGCSKNNNKFVVEWPSSSPYVTAVGGTTMPPSVRSKNTASKASKAVESTASLSGGGFSTFNPRPQWQDSAVAQYLAALKGKGKEAPPNSFYNASYGRAVPDVSAMGTLYSIIVDNTPSVVSGTSASTPTWAGVVSLLNDARFHHGLPAMGFLNPFLYSHPQAFRDITTGTSTPGGMVSSTCGKAQSGWPATVGYDLGTGLGVPDFGKLRIAALNGTKYK